MVDEGNIFMLFSSIFKGDIHQFGGFLFGDLAALVIARCCRYIGVVGHLLHGGNIRAGVQQIADKSTS